MVGLGSAIGVEKVVVLTASHCSTRKATAILKAFYGIDREHRLAKLCVELVEHRFAPTYGYSFYHTAYHSAHRIALLAYGFDIGFHLFG